MLVHSLWHQVDIYGALHVYEAIQTKRYRQHKSLSGHGPWFHHQQRFDGSAIGPIRFGSDTSAYFRHTLVRQFFDHFLKNESGPTIKIYDSGENTSFIELPVVT